MNTKKIIVKDIISSALSNTDGIQLQVAMDQILTDKDNVVISFHGINVMTTSFLNSSIGNLIDKYNIEILSRIKIVDYTPTMATFLKNYISKIKSLSSC